MSTGARHWQQGDTGGWARDARNRYRNHDPWAGAADEPWSLARIGRTPLIIAMVLGFILFWPIGLAVLGYLWWSGKMTGFGRRASMGSAEGSQAGNGWTPGGGSMPGSAMPWANWFSCRRDARPPSSGNHAFDEYRADALRRLEEEQSAFAAYLDRLRFAKDKAEFDQFMAERWQRPTPAADQPPTDQPRTA